MKDTLDKVVQILHQIIGEEIVQVHVNEETKIVGNFENIDSLTIIGILTAIEKEFGFEIYDDDINAEIFTSVGSLCAYVNTRIA